MAMALNYASSIGKNGQKASNVFITCFFDGLAKRMATTTFSRATIDVM
jgi:hypothetical protein